MVAFIVTDLGFGDAGKGTVVDWLAATRKVSLVVRHNGGAQAGHNVVTEEGVHHTFSQWGAATLRRVPTYLSDRFVLHPGAAQREAEVLRGKGVADPWKMVSVHREALVITPYHQLINRLREEVRGGAVHGTCGIGLGEAVRCALRGHAAVRASNAKSRPRLLQLLGSVREWSRTEMESLTGSLEEVRAAAYLKEFEALTPDAVAAHWEEWISRVEVVPRYPDPSHSSGDVVFEGAQGVLLDEWHGFHPHTTWSNTTDDWARDILESSGHRPQVVRIGVTRTYTPRHGAGPLPTEPLGGSPHSTEPHNGSGGAQGRFRAGVWDAVLTRYALGVTGGCDVLAVTHMDAATDPELGSWGWCSRYQRPGDPHPVVSLPSAKRPVSRLDFQVGPTEFLRGCEAQSSFALPTERVLLPIMEEEAGVPVGVVSYGPRATAKRARAPFHSLLRG